MSHGKTRHVSGEKHWDLTGDRIRELHSEGNESGGSQCSSPRPLENGTRVMIALDNSDHSKETIQYYIQHVHRSDNDVTLAHVIELPDNASESIRSMMSSETIHQKWEDALVKAEHIEKQYADILKRAGIDHVHISNQSGLKPGQVLCSLAQEKGMNMLVVGSRGEGKLRRTLLGSVSDYIMHHAHCPVLVCKYGKKHKHHSEHHH